MLPKLWLNWTVFPQAVEALLLWVKDIVVRKFRSLPLLFKLFSIVSKISGPTMHDEKIVENCSKIGVGHKILQVVFKNSAYFTIHLSYPFPEVSV